MNFILEVDSFIVPVVHTADGVVIREKKRSTFLDSSHKYFKTPERLRPQLNLTKYFFGNQCSEQRYLILLTTLGLYSALTQMPGCCLNWFIILFKARQKGVLQKCARNEGWWLVFLRKWKALILNKIKHYKGLRPYLCILNVIIRGVCHKEVDYSGQMFTTHFRAKTVSLA